MRQTSSADVSDLKVHLESVQPDLLSAGLDNVSVTRDDPVEVPSGNDFGVPRHGPENSEGNTKSR